MSFRPKAGRPEWRNLLIIFATVCLTGCRYTFDLEDSDIKPMIALRSCICADSTAVIEVHKTVPVTEISKADTALVNPAYSLRCNGKEVDATCEMIGEGGMRISSQAFRSGDRIEVTFSADGMETVSAGTVIPDEFPEYTLDIHRNSQGYFFSRGHRKERILLKRDSEIQPGSGYGRTFIHYGNLLKASFKLLRYEYRVFLD